VEHLLLKHKNKHHQRRFRQVFRKLFPAFWLSEHKKTRAQSLPIIPGLPDFKDRFISLTSTLSPVLAQVPGTTLAENIDFAALINNFSLTDEQLQTLIKDAKGILVNLKDLSLVSLKANPVFKAVLSAKVPIIFENQSALVDFNNNWTTNEAAQEAEKMAAAVGLGVEGQISILLPTDIDGEFEIALIGATGKNLLENLSKTLEASDMAEDGSDFETPQPVEPTESAPDKILASRTDENSFLTMDGYSNGAFSSYYYRGYKVGEWKKSYWKPDKNQNQRFRNNVRFYVQLTYDEGQNKKWLRIFTVGAFEMLDEPLIDINNQRGYFQFYNKVMMKPVNSSGEVISPTGLTRETYVPQSIELTGNDRWKYVEVKSFLRVKNSGLYRKSGFYRPCFKIMRWISTPGAKWVCKLAEGGSVYQQNFNPGGSWEAHEIWGRLKYDLYTQEITSWRSMIDKIDIASDRVLAGHPVSFIRNHRPHYHLVYAVDPAKQTQRFKLSATQGVRMVWRKTFGTDEGHDDHYNRTNRYITVDFSRVGP
jgi:hypothetical protein